VTKIDKKIDQHDFVEMRPDHKWREIGLQEVVKNKNEGESNWLGLGQ
jgi:hypothetical protein